MDYATIGSVFTVIVFLFFIGIVVWAYSKRSQKAFDEAQNLVFDDEKPVNKSDKRESSNNE